MGWHLWAVGATGPAATIDGLATAGFAPTGETTWLDTATTDLDDGETLAVVPGTGPGLLVVGRFYLDDDVGAALSAGGGRAVTGLWQSVTDSHMLTEHRDGALTRRVYRQHGEVGAEEGSALPEEAGIDWSDPEDGLFALFSAGTGIDLARVDPETEVQVVRRVALPQAPEPPRKKRGLFRR